MIYPAKVCLFIPGNLKRFKLKLFERIGREIQKRGGRVVRNDVSLLRKLPDHIIPIVGCMAECTPLIAEWKARGRTRIQWDRGYLRRVFATNLPRGASGGYYRWHVDSYQMTRIRDVPGDRWASLLPGNNEDPRVVEVLPWSKGGRHIVVAAPTEPYCRFHALKGWTEKTVATLKTLTDRPIIVREKDSETLQRDLNGAHALVAHGSIAAVEAVILGCPVFVHPDSAAALVGLTDLNMIETPIYPDREKWFHSLAYSQFNEKELVDGTLWRLLEN